MPTTSPDRPLRILVIEDDLIFQKIIQTYLRQAPPRRAQVTLAGSLGDGLEHLAGEACDAVLLDLTLPDSEGLRTLERFQIQAPDLPVIVLTGLDDDEIAAEAVRRGAQDFLVKSDLSASILIRSVRYAIERTRAEAALKESERRFRAVVEDQTELVCRYLPSGELTFANRAFCRYFDLHQDEIMGRSFFVLTGAREAAFARLDDPARPTRSREQHLTSEDGSSAWIQWTDRALFDDQDRLVILQSVGRDTTGQKQLERQLYQSQKMETLGRLAGGVAHDFNNLLTVIIACCDMLAHERSVAGEPSHPQIAEIEKAADRAAALTRQLLAVSRRHVAQPVVLDLNQVVRQTDEMLRRLIGERVEIVVRLDPDLNRIKADRAQLEQILVNLVVNARDAMPEGGQLTIETAGATSAAGRRCVELIVSDDGIGMDRETQEKIFEPFFTTKEVGRGTGLGLSIVDSLVKASYGSIAIDSTPGRGTCFRIRLPVTGEALGEEAPASAAGDAASRTRSGSILLVEDERLVRDVVTLLLEPQGYRVLGAASAEEAMSRLETNRNGFDVVLTDVVLPGRNGFQLAEEVKTRYPHVHIVFMSGYTDSSMDDERWLESGASFLQKPFSAEELLGKLDEVLQHPVDPI